jgi:hypothetical protein
MPKFLTPQWIRLKAAGLVSSGQGVGAELEGGPGAIVVSTLLGAFVGVIAGLMLSHLLRFFSMTFNRNLGGYSWVIYGAVIGAAVFAFMAINSEKN